MFLAAWSQSRSRLKKKPGARAGAAWEKIRSRSRMKKKSGAGAAKKIAGSPALTSRLSMKQKNARAFASLLISGTRVFNLAFCTTL